MAKLAHLWENVSQGVSMGWYVMFVETGSEDEICRFVNKRADQMMENLSFRLLVPKRKIYERKMGVRKEVTKFLFPGYILIETDNIEEFFFLTKEVPHIIRFLRNKNVFLQVQEYEMNLILGMVDKSGLISISKAFEYAKRVHIMEGPLYGKEGIIRTVDKRKGRAKVEFELDGGPKLIDLGIDIIKQ